MSGIRVGLEVGKTWVFASAPDWPGWCRRGKGEQAALADYADRYGRVAGAGPVSGPFEVVRAVQGDATTDFGAPGRRTERDEEPLGAEEAGRQTELLHRAWEALDRAALDRAAQRKAIVEALLDGHEPTAWPRRYFLRRATWHVLDHAWELEDKTAP